MSEHAPANPPNRLYVAVVVREALISAAETELTENAPGLSPVWESGHRDGNWNCWIGPNHTAVIEAALRRAQDYNNNGIVRYAVIVGTIDSTVVVPVAWKLRPL
jgi:hypothetical protein